MQQTLVCCDDSNYAEREAGAAARSALRDLLTITP